MNFKKLTLIAVCAVCSTLSFAYPAPQDDDPVNPLLQQYMAQAQQLQQEFDQKLLSPLKATAQLAITVQTAQQTTLTPEQEAQLNQYATQTDQALTQLVEPALKDFDLAQFNTQYQQIAKAYGLPEQTFTLQDVKDMLKALCLISALGYFEQSQKLSTGELEVLMAIFFPQEEETPAQ